MCSGGSEVKGQIFRGEKMELKLAGVAVVAAAAVVCHLYAWCRNICAQVFIT